MKNTRPKKVLSRKKLICYHSNKEKDFFRYTHTEFLISLGIETTRVYRVITQKPWSKHHICLEIDRRDQQHKMGSSNKTTNF